MRLHVVSDVHGAADDLARAADGADALVCLGDLVLYLDYADYTQGIFADLFGPERTQTFVELRTAGRFADAHQFASGIWAELLEREGRDRGDLIEERVSAQYAGLFAAMPQPAYLTYGNVDVPRLWAQHLQPGHQVVDGAAVDIDGLRFGFVGGGLVSPMRTPYEITEEEYAAKVEAVGEVDVLCAHIPPALPELTYDTVARRFEHGSRALLDHVRRTRPRLVLFGHVHQPLVPRARIGTTECVNVGHFRGTRRPFAVTW